MPGTAIQTGYATNRFAGNGSETVWEIQFVGGYIDPAFVKAYTVLNDIETPVSFTWVSNTQIRVTPAVPAGTDLVVYRDTQKGDVLVDFQLGALRTPENLNKDLRQALHVATEATDKAESTVAVSKDAALAAQAALQAATQASSDAAAAQLAATAAGTAAHNAETQAIDAALSAQVAAAQASAAVTQAGAVDGKATIALSNSQFALNTAVAIDGKAQLALDTASAAESNVAGATSAANAATAAANAATAAASAVSGQAAQAAADAATAQAAATAAQNSSNSANTAVGALTPRVTTLEGDALRKDGSVVATGNQTIRGDWAGYIMRNAAGHRTATVAQRPGGGFLLLSHSGDASAEGGAGPELGTSYAAGVHTLTWNGGNLGRWAAYDPNNFAGQLYGASDAVPEGSSRTFLTCAIAGGADSAQLAWTKNRAIGDGNGVFNCVGLGLYAAGGFRIGGTNASVGFATSGTMTMRSVYGSWSFSIASDGNLVLGGGGKHLWLGGGLYATLIQATSDLRKKSGLRAIEDAVGKLGTLGAYTYALQGDDSGRRAGVIAQEVQVVLPEAIRKGSDGFLTVDHSAVIALLVGAVNELTARVRELEAR